MFHHLLGEEFVKKSGSIRWLGSKVCIFMRASSYALAYTWEKGLLRNQRTLWNCCRCSNVTAVTIDGPQKTLYSLHIFPYLTFTPIEQANEPKGILSFSVVVFRLCFHSITLPPDEASTEAGQYPQIPGWTHVWEFGSTNQAFVEQNVG